MGVDWNGLSLVEYKEAMSLRHPTDVGGIPDLVPVMRSTCRGAKQGGARLALLRIHG